MTLRVLHCPWMVGGNPAGLAAAERELGLDSTTIAFRPSPFGYPIDEVVWDDDDGRLVGELKRWRLLSRVLRDFDIVHFNFGSTVMPMRLAPNAPGAKPRNPVERAYAAAVEQLDLRLLARAGKPIFVTFQGDDARQGSVVGRFVVNDVAEAGAARYSPESDAYKRRRIARFDAYADGIYALNPDLLRVLPQRARFVPYAHVDPRKSEPLSPPDATQRPVVLHAPTNRAVKGTRFLVDAIARVQAEGVDVDLRLIEGVTQAEAKALYPTADLVVDQLLVGWYGGLAVETMALERPVVAYLREDDLDVLPAGMRAEIPVVSADPSTIYDVLRELLTTRRAELAEIGRRSRAYVTRWHDPRRIAKELVADYEAAVARGPRKPG
jgi:glycosyltransferase involved in cell wall biosynthesis